MGNNKNQTKSSDFLSRVLETVNKSESEVQKEVLTDRIEDFKVECETQIARIKTSSIPGYQNDLKRAKRDLEKSQLALESAKLDIISNTSFATYCGCLNLAEQNIDDDKSKISKIESNLEYAEKQLSKYKEILKNFNKK